MKKFIQFITENKAPLTGMSAGWIVGYLYWYHVACYTGTFPFASEWWLNCILGAITGGFLVCVIREYITGNP